MAKAMNVFSHDYCDTGYALYRWFDTRNCKCDAR